MKYRIILNSENLYEVQRKRFFKWTSICEVSFDILGMECGYESITFKKIEDAEDYVSNLNKFKRIKVVKYV